MFCNFASLSQPVNTTLYPAGAFSFSGVLPVYVTVSPYLAVFSSSTLPSSFKNFILYVFAEYLACKVISFVRLTTVVLSILLPLSLNHPVKSYPSLVASGNCP